MRQPGFIAIEILWFLLVAGVLAASVHSGIIPAYVGTLDAQMHALAYSHALSAAEELASMTSLERQAYYGKEEPVPGDGRFTRRFAQVPVPVTGLDGVQVTVEWKGRDGQPRNASLVFYLTQR